MNQATDNELMERYQSGDLNAFGTLYELYKGRVMAFIKQHISNSVHAEDVFQEVWLKFHNHRHRYNSQFALGPWIYVLTKNTTWDFLRSNRKKINFQELGEWNALPGHMELEKPKVDLTHLNEREKFVIQQRFWQEQEYPEIAKALGVSTTNVRQIFSRAIKKLKGSTHESQS